MEPRRHRQSIVSVLYNHNPFYLISACCVLYAIKRIFRPMEVLYIDPWMLMAALSGLTIFMAATAWVVVRFGKVWEDARSLMLVLVIMFLAMSVSFDELLNIQGRDGFWLLGLGFSLSVLITESVVRLLKIHLPWLFRMPFYLMLALFFGYPVLVSPEVNNLSHFAIRCRVALFPLVAGLCFLTLLPAVRRGPGLINNGISPCPWKWPLLPWTLFGFLALAVCGRAYYLSISFDPSWGALTDMYTSFGVYALNPFFFCVTLVLLEIAFVQDSRTMQATVLLVMSVVIVACSIPFTGQDPIYEGFLLVVVQQVGSPIFISLFGVFLLGGYAWLRGVKAGEYVVLASLGGLSVVGSQTLTLHGLKEPHVVPVGTMLGILLLTGLARKDAFRCFLSASAISAALATVMWNHELIFFRRILPVHVLLLSIVLIGATLEGRVAGFLHAAGAMLIPIVTVVTSQSFFAMGTPVVLCTAYFVTVTGGTLAYGKLANAEAYTLYGKANVIVGSTWLTAYGSLLLLNEHGIEVLVTVGMGIVCFIAGARITAHKAQTMRSPMSPITESVPKDE